MLATAFELAPMPGFVFSYSGLEHANPAGHGLLRSGRIDDASLVKLHGIVYRPSGPATSRLHSQRGRWTVLNGPSGHGVPGLADYRVCFLLEDVSPNVNETGAGDADLLSASGLNPSQRRIAALLTEGLTNREIGARLGIAAETVRKQVGRILAKTETHTRTELVARMLGKSRAAP